MSQVLYQIAEIDPAVGGKEKNRLTAVELIFNPHQLHRHVAIDNPVGAEAERLLFLLGNALNRRHIIGRGLAFDKCQGTGCSASSFHWGFNYLADPYAAFRFNDHVVSVGEFKRPGIKIIHLAGSVKLDCDNIWQKDLLNIKGTCVVLKK